MNDIKHTQYRVLYEKLSKKLDGLILKYEKFEETNRILAKKTENFSCDKVIHITTANTWNLAKELLEECLLKEKEED